jgi:RNA polymerase sigma-70 factor (ECF subfamily)
MQPRKHEDTKQNQFSRLPTVWPWLVSIEAVSDAELVGRARHGDAAAFGELVDRHRVAVYRAALAALGSHPDAEDVAQEAFLIAYQRLAGFRGEASFKTWLLTIAWHQAINRRRSMERWWRRIRSHPNGAGNEVEREPSSGERSPEEMAAAQQMEQAIRAEIRSLSPTLRDTFVLSQAGEYTYEELAAMQNVPVGTIKWRMSEARNVIRRRLRERGYGRAG